MERSRTFCTTKMKEARFLKNCGSFALNCFVLSQAVKMGNSHCAGILFGL